MADSKGVVQSGLQFFQSLYSDPFRWQVVKSVSLFALGVYIASEISMIEDAPPAPTS